MMNLNPPSSLGTPLISFMPKDVAERNRPPKIRRVWGKRRRHPFKPKQIKTVWSGMLTWADPDNHPGEETGWDDVILDWEILAEVKGSVGSRFPGVITASGQTRLDSRRDVGVVFIGLSADTKMSQALFFGYMNLGGDQTRLWPLFDSLIPAQID